MREYYFSKLNQWEREAYRSLKSGLAVCRPVIDAPFLPEGLPSAMRVMDAVLCDNPGLCFSGVTSTRISLSSRKLCFHPTWVYTEAETQRLKKALAASVRQNLSGLPVGASEYEREKYLHDYAVQNFRYRDCPAEDVRGVHEAHTLIGPLLHSVGVCEGFAKAMLLLLRRAGVPSLFLRGKSAFHAPGALGEGHSWNCVKLGGSPCHLDVTWDNTLTGPGGPIRYDYFNLTDAEISRDHFDYDAPPCTDGQWGYLRRQGLIAASSRELRALLTSAAKRRAASLTFQILPGRKGYPPDPASAVKAMLGAAGIRSCGIGYNPHQHVVMLSSIQTGG